MGRWKSIVVGALALALAEPGPALAQEQTPEEELATITAELVDKLGVLSEALGIEAPLPPRDVLTGALASALPLLPETDDRSWSSSFAFDFKTERITGGVLEPDEEARTVLTDARDCLAPDQAGEVVHFQRFVRGEVRGHRCITAFADEVEGDVWVIHSRTFAEGPDRRMTAFYGVATAVEGDAAGARALLEARLDENVALAGVLADYALEMFLTREATSDPLTTENLPERLARLQDRLGEIAD
jgi:hypothetical protein